jgi:hypothetical protein
MRTLVAAATALGVVLVAASAIAQKQKQSPRDTLTGLYVISIAIDACDLEVSNTQQDRLDAAIELFEGKVGLSDRKLDKEYKRLEKEIEADKKAFCKEVTPIAKAALRDLPDLD